MNDEYGLSHIHKALLNLMNDFDNICKANDIKYSLHGGNLLGAERNGKLIPWDDDMDVSMTRQNYKKLQQVLNKEDSKFYIDNNRYWVPRFSYRKQTNEFICIDILVWDYITENKIGQFIKINLLRALQGMLKNGLHLEHYNSIINKILIIFTWFIGLFLPRRFKLLLHRIIGEHFWLGNKKFIHRSNDAFKGVGYIFDSDYMKEYTTICLEDKEYMVTTRYKEFLIRNYGDDYLTPPPIGERKPLHAAIREK